jgi:hypothetical protein
MNGKYKRKSLVLDFKNITEPKDITKSSQIPEFMAKIPNNFYINGIFNYVFMDPNTGKRSVVIILANIKGINKFCVTPEFGPSNVRLLLFKDFF